MRILRNTNKMLRFHALLASLVGIPFVLFLQGCGDDQGREAAMQSNKAETLLHERSYIQALEAVNKAIVLNSSLKQDSALGENFLLQGTCYRQLGQYDSALVSFQKAVRLFQAGSDQKLERKGKTGLAGFYYVINNNTDALTLAMDVAGAARVFSDYADVYRALMIAANASHRLGEYEREIQSLEELIQIDSVLFHSREKINLLEYELLSYQSAGRYEKVLTVFDRWRAHATSVGDSTAAQKAYYVLGCAQYSLNLADAALRSFSQALGMSGSATDQNLQVEILCALGGIAYRGQHWDNARLYYNDALKSVKQMNNIIKEQLIQLMLIACDWNFAGRRSSVTSPEFIKRCSIVLSTCRQVGFRMGEACALFLQARIVESIPDAESAQTSYSQALELYDQHGSTLPEGSVEANLIDAFLGGEKLDWYQPLLQYYCSRGRSAETFDIIERKNLHSLVEYFSRLTMKTPDAKLNEAINQLQWKLRALHLLSEDIVNELSSGKGRNVERLEILSKLIPQRFDELSSSAKELGSLSQNFRWLLHPPILTLKQVHDTLRTRSALVEYAPFSNALYLLIATRDSVYLRKVSIERSHLLSLMLEYQRLIGDARLNGNTSQPSQQAVINRANELSSILANILVEPVLPMLNSSAQVYIVPPEEFGWLPFHTLRTNGRPLVDRFGVSYLPTAAALLFAEKKESYVSNIIGIGYPGRTQWDVEYELKDIRGFYEKARMLFSTSAALASLDTATYDVLHFATEYYLDQKIPNKSVIILSDGKTSSGMIATPLGEVLATPPPQTLVFSNVSPIAGEFSRFAPAAFLANGTPTVIATMWQGERRAKKYFGEIFYTSLQTGLPASEAYHNAMVALTKRPETSQIYRWGLFYQFGR
ncbi:MAG: CHAT domain-containing protein [Ignavibacteria bacterium]|nr:CHAT domain-containing protein [Ignavibacteria bacterium]MBI3765073.1 CHAT domain-containing protein [Ignavibacteriales bacterium]